MQNDHARRDRAAFLSSTTWYAQRLIAAKQWLGTRYVLHPANRVQRRRTSATQPQNTRSS